MKIPRVSIITLGVPDLRRATRFYEAVPDTPPNTADDGVAFFTLPGAWLALYPFAELPRDISPDVPAAPSGFSGVTLAHNPRSREEVVAVVRRAVGAIRQCGTGLPYTKEM